MLNRRPILAAVTLTAVACLGMTLLLGAAAPVRQGLPLQIDPTQLQQTIDAAVQQALESTNAAQQIQATPNITQTIEAALWQAVTATAEVASGGAAGQAVNSGGPAPSSFSVSEPLATALSPADAPAQVQVQPEAPVVGAVVNGNPPITLPGITVQPITADNVGNLTLLYNMGTGSIQEIAAAPDGRTLAVTTDSGVWFYAADHPGEAGGYIATAHGVHAVAYSPSGDRLAVGDLASNITIYGVGGTGPQGVLSGHTDEITHLAWSPDGTQLASSGGYDRTVRVWDVASGAMRIFEAHDDANHYMNYVSWSPDGARLATAGWDGIVRVYAVASGELLGSMDNGIWANCVEWSPDGTRIATTGDDNRLNLWDAQTYDWLSSLTGPGIPNAQEDTSVMWRAIWSPDGGQLVSLTWLLGGGEPPYGVASVWNAASGEHLNDLWQDFSLDTITWVQGRGALVAHSAQAFLLDGAQEPRVLIDHLSVGRQSAWSPDGMQLAGALGNEVVIWDAMDGAPLARLVGISDEYRAVAWSPDGGRIAGGGREGRVEVWDVGSRTSLNDWRANTDGASMKRLAWSPDGTRLVTLDVQDRYQLWDAQAGRLLAVLEGPVLLSDPVWSPDGGRIAIGGIDHVIVWDAYDGSLLDQFEVPGGNVIADVTYSPDGTSLAVVGSDSQIRLIDAYTGESLSTDSMPSQYSSPPVWAPDGSLLALANSQYLIVWRINEQPWGPELGGVVARRPVPEISTSDLLWSPDGTRLAWRTLHGVLQAWGTGG